ncbi:MAG TPA: hypothetical protein VHM24_09105 [Gemmatimonadaceae bacterium]|nr:hypothetical protein [Gemmatimonadaceae bacterium]
MTTRRLVMLVLLAEAFAVATYGLGWWSVPLVAIAWAALSSDDRAPRTVALCAAAGWGTLLILDVMRGQVGRMSAQLGELMHVPPVVLYLLTLGFPALLAWSAAVLVPRLRDVKPR